MTRLLDRAGTSGVVDPVKQFYRVQRPYIGSAAPICQARTAALAGNGDYPSGHAAGGWMEALLLAELAPDRATEILARGRAFGESRLICGAHSLSAVEAGWLAGAAATAALHGSAEFRADLEAARDEMATVRASAPRAPRRGLPRRGDRPGHSGLLVADEPALADPRFDADLQGVVAPIFAIEFHHAAAGVVACAHHLEAGQAPTSA